MVDYKKTLSAMVEDSFSFLKELKNDSDVYIALFENKEEGVIPDKMAFGINKHTGKVASSIKSLAAIEDAIS